MPDVREALRHELQSRGLDVASDTVASRGELYVRGDRDLAAAMFEFKPSAQEAFDTMYQGRWTEGLPPRFVVLPSNAAEDPSFELLEQVQILPILFELAEDRVVFIGLDAAFERLRG